MKKICCCVVMIFISLCGFAQDVELFRKDGHKSELQSISISPDNKYFISVETDTLAIIWDIATGQQLRTIKNVETAVFRDNNSIYLAMNDKTFKMVDLFGQTIKEYESRGARYNYNTSFILNDTRRIFYPEKGLYLFGDDVFDMDKGYLKRLSPGGGYRSRDFSPATNLMATSNKETGKVSIINIESGLVTASFQSDISEMDLMRLSFSSDGGKLLICTPPFLQIIDIPTGKILKTIKNVQFAGEDAMFSPDGETIAFAAKDYDKHVVRISILNSRTGERIWGRDFNNIGFFVNMQFAPDGNTLAFWINTNDEKPDQIIMLDTKKGNNVWVKKQEDFVPSVSGSSLQFSSDGKKLLLGNNKKLLSVNTATGHTEKIFEQTSQGAIKGIHFIKNNSQLVSSIGDHFFNWDLQTGEVEKFFLAKDKKVEYQIAYFKPTGDGKRFFVIREDNLRELDTSGRMVFQYASPNTLTDRLNLAVSFDGQYVMNQGNAKTANCAGNKDVNTVEVFDTKTHKLVYTNNCVIGEVSFAKTQNILVLQEVSNLQLLRFYDIPSGKLLYDIRIPNLSLQFDKPVFSETDQFLTVHTAEINGSPTVRILIDLKTRAIRQIPITMPASININDEHSLIDEVGFTPDGKYIVYSGRKVRRFFFYDMEQGNFDEQMTLKYPANIETFSSIEISPNGNFLVLGTYTGTIMLWSIAQHKLLGTLYPDAANQNWAVVTSQGQFDGNTGAQENMFHVSGNTVVPLSAMFEKFYTPRLLPRILADEKFEPVNVNIKELKKAPTVKLQFKEGLRNLEVGDDGMQTIQTKVGNASVAITAECPLDRVTEIRLYQNGKLVETTRNLTVEDDGKSDKTLIKTFQINLVEGTNRFKAIALNTERTESRPVEMNVIFKPADKKLEIDLKVSEVQLHLIVVGINIYKNTKYNLNYAMDDAEAFKLALENGAKSIFGKVNTHFIKDAEATKAGIVAALEKVKDQAGAEDVFVFYFAGHGVVNDRKEFFLVPSDVVQLYGSDDALAQKGLSAASLQQFSKDIKAQKQLYILDACQSAGALDNIVAFRGAAEEKAIAQLARSTGTHWLTASGSSQFATEFSQLGHGAFTYCLLEALKGGADNGDKKISIKELDTYLQLKVPEVTEKYKGTAQYPASYGYGNDFPIIIIK